MILAGGRSSRMGQDKGWLPFRGRPLVESVIGAARTIGSKIRLITANPAYESLGYPCHEDEITGMGPLGGILSGLRLSDTRKNLVLGCDMPFLYHNLLASLVEAAGEEDVLLTEHRGKAEPLCSVYDVRCIPTIEGALKAGRLKVTDALEQLNVRTISFDDAPWFQSDSFANLNTLEALQKYDQ